MTEGTTQSAEERAREAIVRNALSMRLHQPKEVFEKWWNDPVEVRRADNALAALEAADLSIVYTAQLERDAAALEAFRAVTEALIDHREANARCWKELPEYTRRLAATAEPYMQDGEGGEG